MALIERKTDPASQDRMWRAMEDAESACDRLPKGKQRAAWLALVAGRFGG
jgi:hypothetical protein